MITRESGEGLVCIRQVDHARAAGRLAEVWGNDAIPPLTPRDRVVGAVAHHDDGWSDHDDEPVFDPESGVPYTYRTHPLEDQLEIARRSVERTAGIHPYSAWLISRHFASFHAGREEPERIAWVVSQISERARLLAEARSDVGREALHPHVLEANFDRLQLLDALSLAVCHDWDEWESRSMAVDYGGEVRPWRYSRVGSKGGSELEVEGRVDPWPFERDRIEVSIPARRLVGTRWEGPESLEEAWAAARAVTLEAALVRG